MLHEIIDIFVIQKEITPSIIKDDESFMLIIPTWTRGLDEAQQNLAEISDKYEFIMFIFIVTCSNRGSPIITCPVYFVIPFPWFFYFTSVSRQTIQSYSGRT